MTNRQKRAIKTKKNIYNAAISLMQKQGIQQTTIEEICKKSKVSVGSFYNYFKSKYDVLQAIYESADTYFEDTVAGELKNLNDKDKIIEFFRHYALYNKENGLDFTKHLYFNSENKLFLAPNRYMHTLLRNILEETQADNSINTGLSLDEVSELLFLIARGIVCDWCLHDGGYDLEQKTVLYFETILAQLYTRPASFHQNT